MHPIGAGSLAQHGDLPLLSLLPSDTHHLPLFSYSHPSSSAMATMSLQPAYKLHPHAALLDGAITSQEWSMYTEVDPKSEYADERIPPPRQDQLTKATKDLMALDSTSLRWNESADRHTATDFSSASSSTSTSTSTSNSTSSGLTLNTSFIHQPSHPTALSHPSPFLSFPSPQSPSVFNGSLALLHRSPMTVAPNHTIDTRSSASQRSDPSPSPPMPPVGKRPSDLSITTDGASSSSSSRQPTASKKRRTSPLSASAGLSNGGVCASGYAAGSVKPALLSPSQKKANHIQSEQKRRANIRRGYDALCDTVPALREAIQKEEEELAALAAAAVAQEDKNGKAKSRKKNRGKKGAGGAQELAEKVDGRAGPKSENVVLQKTIDYINELLEEKATLQDRMNRARSYLSPGHPALVPLSDQPLWEREWTGGLGILDDVDGADSDDEDAES